MITAESELTVIDVIEYLSACESSPIAIRAHHIKSITYREFNQEINKRAHFLLSLLGNHTSKQTIRIGILNERSLETLLWMFAIWKCGCSFLLLEPKELISATTQGRGTFNKIMQTQLAFVLAPHKNIETLIQAIQTNHNQPALLNAISINPSNNINPNSFYTSYLMQDDDLTFTIKMVALEKINLSHFSTDNPPKINLFEDKQYPQDGKEAYVIFTSGSTGKPKGCLIHHAGLHNFFKSLGNTLKIKDSNDTTLWSTNLDFDPVIGVPCFTFICGGSLYVANDAELNNTEEFFSSCAKQQINIMLMVPTLAKNILGPAEQYLSQIKNLRMMFTGEKMDAELLRSYGNIVIKNNGGIFNAYGPTEGPIGLTMTPIKIPVSKEEWDNLNISIGKVIAGRKIYLIKTYPNNESPQAKIMTGDEYLPAIKATTDNNEEVAIGELIEAGEGEIVYESVGFVGYLNDQTATLKRRAKINGKYYWRTGDIAEYVIHNNQICKDHEYTKILKYTGRIDNQLKIAGVRIQPEGLEVLIEQLKDHVISARTVVIKQLKLNGQTIHYPIPRIVTFYVKRHDNAHQILTRGIRQYLQSTTGKSVPCHYLLPVDTLSNAGSINGKFKNEELIEKYKNKIIETIGLPQTMDSLSQNKIYEALCNIARDVLSLDKSVLLDKSDISLSYLGASSLELILFKDLLCTSKLLADSYEQSSEIFDQYNKEFLQEGINISELAINTLAQLIYEYHSDKNAVTKINNGDIFDPLFIIINEGNITKEQLTQLQKTITQTISQHYPIYIINSTSLSQSNHSQTIAKRLSRIIKKLQNSGPYYVCVYQTEIQLINNIQNILNPVNNSMGLYCNVIEQNITETIAQSTNDISAKTINLLQYDFKQLQIVLDKQREIDLEQSVTSKIAQIKRQYAEIEIAQELFTEEVKKMLYELNSKLHRRKHIFISGYSGTGKTLLTKHLLKLNALENGDFVLRIDLSINQDKPLTQSLQHMGFTLAEIEHLKKQKTTIIFDGLNRLSENRLESFISDNTLLDWQKARFIITYEAKLNNDKFYQSPFKELMKTKSDNNTNNHPFEFFLLSTPVFTQQQTNISLRINLWFTHQLDKYPVPDNFNKIQLLDFMYQYCQLLANYMDNNSCIRIEEFTIEQFYKQLEIDNKKSKLEIQKYLFDFNDNITRYLFLTAPVKRITTSEGDFIEFIDNHFIDFFKSYVSKPIDFPIKTEDKSHRTALASRNLMENIRPYNIGAPQQPLFLLPPITGEFAYKDLVATLDNTLPIYEFQHPALSVQNLEYADVHEQINYYVEKIHELYPNGPIGLVGWSFGGFLSVLVALSLIKTYQREINYIGIIDTPGPEIWDNITVADFHKLLLQRLAWIKDHGILEKIIDAHKSSVEVNNFIQKNGSDLEKAINDFAQMDIRLNNLEGTPKEQMNKLIEIAFNKIQVVLVELLLKAKSDIALTASLTKIKKSLQIMEINLKANISLLSRLSGEEGTLLRKQTYFYAANTNDEKYYSVINVAGKHRNGWPEYILSENNHQMIDGATHFTLMKEQHLKNLAKAIQNDFLKNQIPVPKFRVSDLLDQLANERLSKTNDVYVESDCYFYSKDNRLNLYKEIKKFIKDKQRFLALLGESGLGKTSFCINFHDTENKNYQKKQSDTLIIYINTYTDPQECIRQYFIKRNFSEYQIENVLRYEKFLFIFDNSDSGAYFNAAGFDKVLSIWLNSKIILTMQPKYFNENNKSPLFVTKLYIADFNQDQCNSYIHKVLNKNIIDFNALIQELPQDIISNPMILSMLIKLYIEAKNINILDITFNELTTKVSIYKKFIDNNIYNEWLITKAKLAIPSQIQPAVLKEHIITIGKAIAVCMLYNNNNYLSIDINKKYIWLFDNSLIQNIVINYLDILNAEILMNLPRFEIEYLLRALPLTKNQNQLKFTHQSYLDYLFALTVFDLIEDYCENQKVIHSNTLFNVIKFMRNNGVLDYLGLMISQSPNKIKIIKFMYEKGIKIAIDKAYAVTASNFIAALVRARVALSGWDLSNIWLIDADMNYVILDNANLFNAKLINVSMKGGCLRECNLNEASLDQLFIGEMPYIKYKKYGAKAILSPDEQWLAVINGKMINVYRTNNLALEHTFTMKNNQKENVRNIAFSPDNKLIAACNESHLISLLQLKTWSQSEIEINEKIYDKNIEIFSIAFNLNSSELALGDRYGNILFWSLSHATLLSNKITYKHDYITQISFLPDGKTVAIKGGGSEIEIRSLSGRLVDTFSTGGHSSFAINADGSLIAVANYNNAQIWNIKNHELLATFELPTHIDCIAIHPNNQIIATNAQNNIYLFDLSSKKIITKLIGHQHYYMTYMKFTNDGKQLISSCNDGTVRFWMMENELNIIDNLTTDDINGAVAHPTQNIIYSISGTSLKSWQLSDGKLISNIEQIISDLKIIAINSNGSLLAISNGKVVLLIDTQTKKLCAKFDISSLNKSGWTHHLIFSPDGKFLTVTLDEIIQIWDIANKQLLKQLATQNKEIKSIHYSLDGQLLLYIIDDTDGGDRLWAWDTRAIKKPYIFSSGNSALIKQICISPDQQTFAAINADATIKIWDIKQAQIIKSQQTKTSSSILVYDKEGKLLATAEEYCIRIWDVQNLQCTTSFTEYPDYVRELIWTNSGKLIVTTNSYIKCLKPILIDNLPVNFLLEWTTKNCFYASNCKIENVKNLSDINLLLLKQHGAVDENKNIITEASSNPLHSDVNLSITNEIISHKSLHLAAKLGFTEALRQLIANTQNLETKDKNGATPLHVAVKAGHVDAVQLLLSSGADIAAKDNYLQTALHYAAKNVNEFIALILLEHQAMHSSKDYAGRTPLHLAGGPAVVNLLIANGAEIENKDNDLKTALHYAAENGNEFVVKTLLEQHALHSSRDNSGQTPLHLAGGCAVVDLLIENGANIEARDDKGRTPLHTAALNNYDYIIKTLAKINVDLHAVSNDGKNALHYSASKDNEESFLLLLQLGLNYEAFDNQQLSVLHIAAINNSSRIIKILISKGVSLECRDSQGMTPLHHATLNGRAGAMSTLLELNADINAINYDGESPIHLTLNNLYMSFLTFYKYGADMNARDKNGVTFFHSAVSTCTPGILNKLDDLGINKEARDHKGKTPLFYALPGSGTAFFKGSLHMLKNMYLDFNAKDINGITPLHIAVIRNDEVTVKAFLELNADPNMRDNEGKTPIFNAVFYERTELINILSDFNADLNIKDKNGRTPLYTAVYFEKVFSLKKLIELHANVEINDNDGRTALHMAVKYPECEQIVKILVNAGANVNAKNKFNSVIHESIKSKNLNILQTLLDKGADVDTLDCNGNTALVLASNCENIELMTFLIEYGANIEHIDTNGLTIYQRCIINDKKISVEFLSNFGLSPGHSTQAKSLIDETNLALSNHELKKTIAIHEQINQLYPSLHWVRHNCACYQLELSQVENNSILLGLAEENLLKVINDNFDTCPAVDLGLLYFITLKYEKAIALFEKAIKHKDDDRRIYFDINSIHTLPSELQAELKSLEKLDLKVSILAYYLLLRCKQLTHKVEQINPLLKEFENEVTNSNNHLDYSLLGYIYKFQNIFDKAAFFFEKAWQIKNDYLLADQNCDICNSLIENNSLPQTQVTQEAQNIRQKYLSYNDDEINLLINVQATRIGSFAKGNQFLLLGKDSETYKDDDDFNYYILVTPTIDTEIKDLPPDYFRDIFDEIKDKILNKSEIHIKLLFPYKITQTHWLTGEIKIHRKNKDYKIELTAHDPYGKGRIIKNNYKKLCVTIEKQIKALDPSAILQFHCIESIYKARLQNNDTHSCGVIVVDEMVKRIEGKTLELYAPHPAGAEDLRRLHIVFINYCITSANVSRNDFLKRHQMEEKYNPKKHFIHTDEFNKELLNKILNNDAKLTRLNIYPPHEMKSSSDVELLCVTLKENHVLTSVSLNDNRLRDDGVKKVCLALIPHPKLTSLSLGLNYFGDEGAMQVARFIQFNKSIQEIVLSYNNISDAGAKEIIMATKYNSSLTCIDLSDNKISHSCIEVITAAIKDKPLLTVKLDGNTVDVFDYDKDLLNAAQRSNLDDVEKYLRMGASIKIKDSHGRNILLLAASNGNLRMMQFLCERNDINLSERDNYGADALSIATQYGHVNTVRWLNEEKEQSLKTKDIDNNTPIVIAAMYNKLNVLKWLVNKGCSVMEANIYGNTALHYLCTNNNTEEAMEYLIQQNADIDKPNYFGMTPVGRAAREGKLDGVQFLYNKKANITYKNIDGIDALILAALNEQKGIIEFLNTKGYYLNHQLLLKIRDKIEELYQLAIKYHDKKYFLQAYVILIKISVYIPKYKNITDLINTIEKKITLEEKNRLELIYQNINEEFTKYINEKPFSLDSEASHAEPILPSVSAIDSSVNKLPSIASNPHTLFAKNKDRKPDITQSDYWLTAEEIDKYLKVLIKDKIEAQIYSAQYPLLKAMEGNSSALFKEILKMAFTQNLPALIPISVLENAELQSHGLAQQNNIVGDHWISLAIQPCSTGQFSHEIYIIDSNGNGFNSDIDISSKNHFEIQQLGNKVEIAKKQWERVSILLGLIQGALHDYSLSVKPKIIVTGNAPQENGSDCGIFVVYNLAAIAKRQPLPTTPGLVLRQQLATINQPVNNTSQASTISSVSAIKSNLHVKEDPDLLLAIQISQELSATHEINEDDELARAIAMSLETSQMKPK